MSVLDRVREQKEKTEQTLARGGGSNPGVKFWRPKDGQNRIRIMPSWTDEAPYENQFWREVAQHWNVSEDQTGPVLCPKQTPNLDGDCPICEFVEELKADRTNVESQKLAKELKAKTTYFLNVVAEDDNEYTAEDVSEWKQNRPDQDPPFEPGDTKVQIYACPVTIFDQILGLISSSGEDLTDPEGGRHLTIKKIANKKDRIKTRYEVYPDFQQSKFEVDRDSLPALDQVGFTMEYDSMKELLVNGKGGEFAGKLKSGSSGSLPSGSSDYDPDSQGEEEESSEAGGLEDEMRKQLGK